MIAHTAVGIGHCSCQTATAATGWGRDLLSLAGGLVLGILVLVSIWRTAKTALVTPAGIEQKVAQPGSGPNCATSPNVGY